MADDDWACINYHLFKCESALGGMAVFVCRRAHCGVRAEAMAHPDIVRAARDGAPWEWVRTKSRKVRYDYPKDGR